MPSNLTSEDENKVVKYMSEVQSIRIRLMKWILDGWGVWSGLVWLRIGTGGGPL
jgi:hypothetical protein